MSPLVPASLQLPRSQPSSQGAMPLVAALRRCRDAPDAAFYTPGHKRGRGISQALQDLLGKTVFQADLPELPALDNLFAPEGAIAQAQTLAAELFGADHTWFLANGSTCGLQAAVLATCRPGDRLILPRNCHQSAIAALILAGVHPIFVQPEVDSDWGLAHGLTPDAVAAALAQYPDARAVMLVSPTYYGMCSDVRAIAHVAHQHQIPLIVDEAHGAHLAFHSQLPASALEAGADLVVQSTHKVLSALTQASMLHLQGPWVDPARVCRALPLVQSSSPSYLLLASLDAARHQMAHHGAELMARTLDLAAQARDHLAAIPQLKVLSLPAPTPGCAALDPTRLTVDVSPLGMTGFAADDCLSQQWQVTCELPGLRHLTFIISLGNTPADIDALVQGLGAIAATHSPTAAPIAPLAPFQMPGSIQVPPVSPRDAFFALAETVLLVDAGDRLSAEMVCPYPPGIPVLLPGDRLTAAALEYLTQVQAAGGVITGCEDASLTTLKVLCRDPTLS
ncbi:MAG: aminotransferase class I/II-fold pyridoxal phosphate-dependent enzyme [Kaiparowitsia implicata GSE-PSE-MK54-09C]|jgi:arginine decarboxylase|nr:aminotransferase class I/II-fold pyridoxal phosphate-dependent enzyme [Kaiparowitsia implicata GSE-PSE-MK54-09C]